MRLIDANAIPWTDLNDDLPTKIKVLITFADKVNRMPTIEGRKTGMWEEIEVIPEAYDIAGIKTWASKMQCNQCGFTTFAIEGKFAQYNFCPNCGAWMER